MRIRELMIPDPITVTEKASIQEAIDLMKTSSIRHLPVVGEGNILKGFVTLSDLKQGLIPSMVGGLTLSDLMIRNPLTVNPEDDIEIAATLIYKHKIGGIPVVVENRLVGILTESDILRAFIDMMGILTASSRIDVAGGTDSKSLNRALQIIQNCGGDVMNVAMTTRQGKKRIYHFRLAPGKTEAVQKALEKEGFRVLDTL